MKVTATRPRIMVTADGRGVVSHAGSRLLADLADVSTAALAGVLLLAARTVRLGTRTLDRWIGRFVPRVVADLTGAVLAGLTARRGRA